MISNLFILGIWGHLCLHAKNGGDSKGVNCLDASLLSGTFPNSLKTSVVKPLLKSAILITTMLSDYRPISNITFIGKIIEKVFFLNQLNN